MAAARRILLEIAVESPADALAAAGGGADRLELCADLRLDGLTPAPELLRSVRAVTTLPLMTMIRPRPGNSVYHAAELIDMERQIEAALADGADGLVFGVLGADGRINEPACRALIARSAGKPAVFHRAFDRAPDPFDALERLIGMGFARVLTSGRATTAVDGAATIARLIEQSAGRIEILPGGAVRAHNAAEIIRVSGCTQLHSSCPSSSGGGADRAMVAALRDAADRATARRH